MATPATGDSKPLAGSKQTDAIKTQPSPLKTSQAPVAKTVGADVKSAATARATSVQSAAPQTAHTDDEEDEYEEEDEGDWEYVPKGKLSSLAMPEDYKAPKLFIDAKNMPISVAASMEVKSSAAAPATSAAPTTTATLGSEMPMVKIKKLRKKGAKKKREPGAPKRKRKTMMKSAFAFSTLDGERETLNDKMKKKRGGKIGQALQQRKRRRWCQVGIGIAIAAVIAIVLIVVVVVVVTRSSNTTPATPTATTDASR